MDFGRRVFLGVVLPRRLGDKRLYPQVQGLWGTGGTGVVKSEK